MRALFATFTLALLVACGGAQDAAPPKITSMGLHGVEGRTVRYGEVPTWTATFEGAVSRVRFEAAGQVRDLPPEISGKVWGDGERLTESGVARLTVEGPGGTDIGEYRYEVMAPKIEWEQAEYLVAPGQEFEMRARTTIAGSFTSLTFFPRSRILDGDREVLRYRATAPEIPLVSMGVLVWSDLYPGMSATTEVIVGPWTRSQGFRVVNSQVVPARFRRGEYAEVQAHWMGVRVQADINGVRVPNSGDVLRFGPLEASTTFTLTLRTPGAPQPPVVDSFTVLVE